MTKYTLEAIAFRYEELSEEAKQKAYLAWLASQDQSLCSDEFRETLSKFWKANGAYVHTWEYRICDLFDPANKIKERNLFLFLPLPRKKKVPQSGKTWRLLVRDLLSLKDTGWGPP